jgi:exosortase
MGFSPSAANSAQTGSVEIARRGPVTLGVSALALCWVLVFNALRVDWSTNPQYAYGWFVPLLALGLLLFRWTTRPEPARPLRIGLVSAIALGALALQLPIRLVEEANPEWRMIQWVHAGQTVVLTLCSLYLAGGGAWARHFAFVACFPLVAVPWPVPLETLFVQNLMRVVAAITVEAVGLINIPAVQHGNLIEISSGLVGVNEACSGVRSLQTAFFVCLFLGELYRFSWSRRGSLLLLGFIIAVLCNVGRTFFLVASAARHGLGSMDSMHDTAGGVVLVTTLLLIVGLAHLLRRPQPNQPLPEPQRASPNVLPLRATAGVLAWILAAEVSTELWYRLHESNAVENSHWSAVWPGGPDHTATVPIDSTVLAMLRCNVGKAGVWEDGIGNRWQAYFFRWSAGRNSAQLASAHTPDICLRGVGYELTSDIGVQNLSLPNLELPFRQYVFTKGHTQLHVFYCRWEDQRLAQLQPAVLREDGSQLSRLEAVRAGRRHLGQQVLEITVNGPATSEAALAALANELPRIIRK